MSTESLNQKFIYVPTPALVTSFIIHLCIPLFFLFAGLVGRFLPFMNQKKASKQIYQEFIQVDVVALPDQLINEKFDASLPEVEKVKAEPAPEPKPVPEETMTTPEKAAELANKKAKDDAQKAKERKEKQEAEKALKKLEEEAKREAALKALAKKNGKSGRPKIAGNIVSKGTAMTGAIGTAKDRYHSLVTQAIREHFNVLMSQKKRGLIAVVHIEIYPTGRVRERKLVKPSTDQLYNTEVIQAIDSAQPLPLPEDPSVLNGGFTIEFRPEDK